MCGIRYAAGAFQKGKESGKGKNQVNDAGVDLFNHCLKIGHKWKESKLHLPQTINFDRYKMISWNNKIYSIMLSRSMDITMFNHKTNKIESIVSGMTTDDI